MRLFEVDAYGPFPRERIHVNWTDVEPTPCAELESIAQRTWETHLEAVQKVGGVLFNGRLVRLLSAEVRDDALILDTCPTDYVRFLGTNFLNPHLAEAYGWEAYSNPVGTSAVVVTSDQYLVLGRRSREVASHAGMVHTFGGAIEPDDRNTQGQIDPYGGMARELIEELHLEDLDQNELICLGMTRDSTICQPELIFQLSLPMTRDELEQHFQDHPTEHRQEHTELVSLPGRAEAILPFIQSQGLITPIAASTLCLYGRHAYGKQWFEATRRFWI